MILCLDYGKRYIGLAITDSDERFALRHSVIDQKKRHALKALQELVATEQVTQVLVGVPVSLSGSISEQTKTTQAFITKLRNVLNPAVTIIEVDETLTSVEAEQHIKEEKGNPADTHAEAARIMLEDYLRQHNKEG